MTHDKWWIVTFILATLGFILFPQLRILFTILLIAHSVLLYWGISNIRSGFFVPVLYKKDAPSEIALTFDDGPDPSLTPDILTLLDKYKIKATFFVVAERAKKYPAITKAIHYRKHIVACHDLNHSYTGNFRLGKAMFRDISKAQGIIKEIIGLKPLLYRPPVGLTNPHLAGALKKLNMKCIGWDKSVRDAGNRREKVLYKIEALAQAGSVILLHDTLPNPELKGLFLKQLEALLISIRSKKLVAKNIGNFFGIRNYE